MASSACSVRAAPSMETGAGRPSGRRPTAEGWSVTTDDLPGPPEPGPGAGRDRRPGRRRYRPEVFEAGSREVLDAEPGAAHASPGGAASGPRVAEGCAVFWGEPGRSAESGPDRSVRGPPRPPRTPSGSVAPSV